MTATVFKARVWELATVTGTGSVSLVGTAQQGYQNFAAHVPSGSLVCYTIYDPTAYTWETGMGTWTISTSPSGTMTRNVSESSNSNALVSFAGNQCNVTLDIISPAQTSAGAPSAGLVVALNPSGIIDSSMLESTGYTTPVLASFTIANQPASSTVIDTIYGLAMAVPVSRGSRLLLWNNAPYVASPSSFIIGCDMSGDSTGGPVGIAIGDGSGKFVEFFINIVPTASKQLQLNYMSSPSSGTFQSDEPISFLPRFLAIYDDGTNFNLYFGAARKTMILWQSIARNAFIGAPTQYGLTLDNNGGNGTQNTIWDFEMISGAP